MSDYDRNAIASLLKLYLRELPEPLIPVKLIPKFEAATSKSLSVFVNHCPFLRGRAFMESCVQSVLSSLLFMCHFSSQSWILPRCVWQFSFSCWTSYQHAIGYSLAGSWNTWVMWLRRLALLDYLHFISCLLFYLQGWRRERNLWWFIDACMWGIGTLYVFESEKMYFVCIGWSWNP